jgi:hypothetical protein
MIDSGMSLPVGFMKNFLIMTYKFIINPKETYYISKNIIKGLWRYYKIRDRKYNFVINRRLSHHTIYPDGTLITFTKYSIFMLDNGNFKIKKSYRSENDGLIDKKRKVDMSKMPEIYMHLNKDVKEDRFKDFLTITELITSKKTGSRFFSEKSYNDSNEIIYQYSIQYTKLSRFEHFSFFVSMTIPKEFDRVSKSDGLIIRPNLYGIYEFHSKIDKQGKNSHMFEPILHDTNNKEIKVTHSPSLYYIGV